MIISFLNVLPVFLLIVTGYLVKKYMITVDEFWKSADSVVYYIFFPALLVLKISVADFGGHAAFNGIAVAMFATTIIGFIAFTYKILFKIDDTLFTSVFQGSVRYNSYIFIALSASFLGEAGVALSGLFIAVMILFTNVISVFVMNIYGEGNKKSFSAVLYKTALNPLIIGAVIGVSLNFGGIHLEKGALVEFLYYLGGAAMPLSLMSIGAGLIFNFNNQKKAAIGATVLLKLLILPLIAILGLSLVSVHDDVAKMTVLYCAVPCAGNAYILARQMGGDAEAMASIITWGTICSSVTIPLIMFS